MSVTRHGGRTFDWVARHDERSRDFAAARLVPVAPTKAVWWTGGLVLDQGQEGSCTGHGVTGEYLASPVRGRVPDAQAGHELAVQMYLRARQLDHATAADGEGASVNSAMKAGRERGWWDSYHWAFGVEDVKKALLLGPVVIGINWYDAMYETDANGIVRVDGDVVGGHCLLVTGWSPSYGRSGEVFRWRNSWGQGYGKAGNGYVPVAAFDRLLSEQGEAAVPTGRHLGKGL